MRRPSVNTGARWFGCHHKESRKLGSYLGIEGAKKQLDTNLQYTGDTLLFGQVNVDQAVILKWILHAFELWSGLKIYFQKSQLIFLGKPILSQVLLREYWIVVGAILDYLLGHLDLDWTDFSKCFNKKLDGWKGKSLSFDRIIVI